MKKMFIAIIGAVVVATVATTTTAATTNGLSVGVCAVFPGGGDVENGEMGFGVQGVMPLNETFDTEISILKFGDSLGITEMSLTQYAVTLRAGRNVSEQCRAFVGGGINYNQMEADIVGQDINVQMEDVVGYHGTIGLDFRIQRNWSLFADYRLTKLNTTAVVGGYGESEVVEGTYDHGIGRVGVYYTF